MFSRETPLVFRQQRRAPAASRAPDSGAAVAAGTGAIGQSQWFGLRAPMSADSELGVFREDAKARAAEKIVCPEFQPSSYA